MHKAGKRPEPNSKHSGLNSQYLPPRFVCLGTPSRTYVCAVAESGKARSVFATGATVVQSVVFSAVTSSVTYTYLLRA